ncbi:DUF4031 domain-containing protein [Amycolatopsis roodepoortensis]|nr:DUF4031 domain-containing protein [Amycolatopsis roodepoortensis]
MTVYVDDFSAPARVGGRHGRWSHMIADTEDELHAFAARLGLQRSWFQDPRVRSHKRLSPARPGSFAAETWHYDITRSKRDLALQLGAADVGWRDLPDLIKHRMAHGTCRSEQPRLSSTETQGGNER